MVRYHNSGTQKFDDTEHDSVNTDAVNYNGVVPDYRIVALRSPVEDSDQTTVSTSFEIIYDMNGNFDLGELPSGMTLYGRFVAVLRNDTSDETTTARPAVRQFVDEGIDELPELDISVTSTSLTKADSGWVEITTPLSSDGFEEAEIRAKVSGGTGTVEYQTFRLEFAGVSK